jgi:sulfite reductase (ferredoxin)
MLKFYENSSVLISEQDQFERDIQVFINGEMNPIQFKAIRVAHGVYEQRERETYMIRIRCAAGGITPRQLRKVAELAEKYGAGEVHFTTRQEVQIHDAKIDQLMAIIRGLNEVELSSRGGGGNTIRNILTSPDSGVDPETEFDVDPYAMELTTRLINEEDSWNLPRKFKIAMSHNTKDTTYTQATCLGYVAEIRNGQKGFRVYCSGGMGARPMVGNELLEWIPDTQVYHVARALKSMFDVHGNRRSKFSSRIKFLWKKLGDDDFKKTFHEYYDKIKDDRSLDLKLPKLENKANDIINLPVESASGEAFELWKRRYVFPQLQAGLFSVKIPLKLGDLLKKDADILCDFLDHIGENTIRCDRAQNMRLRNIPEKYIPNLYNVITKMEMTLASLPPFIGNMINCTGAQTCKLGICLPRGLSDAIGDRLVRSDLRLDEITDFKVNMSGCPNTCGMHHVADLGFFGKIGRKDGEIFPMYNVMAGAKTSQVGQLQYAERVDEIASKFVPDFVHEFLGAWIEKKDAYKNDYHAFLDAEGKALIKTLCDHYRDVPTYEQNPEVYHDWGRNRRMTLDDMGAAECSAGMFDMIDVDKKEIEAQIEVLKGTLTGEALEETLYNVTFRASRMLLVTRGLDAKTDAQVFEHFQKHFITTGLIDVKFTDVTTLAKLGLKAELAKHNDTVIALGQAVIDLYKNMDDSLRFKPQSNDAEAAPSGVTLKDYRGVACPMNFVKTKLVLETLNKGDKLEVLLDNGEPIENVPNSVAQEGHKILKKEHTSEGHWSVVIEKC